MTLNLFLNHEIQIPFFVFIVEWNIWKTILICVALTSLSPCAWFHDNTSVFNPCKPHCSNNSSTGNKLLQRSERSGSKKIVDSGVSKTIYLQNLGIGFGNLIATTKNIPPGAEEEPKGPDVAEIFATAASNCCSNMCNKCCCMCCIQCCSKLNDQCGNLLTQICTALACFGCLDCFSTICCSGSEGSWNWTKKFALDQLYASSLMVHKCQLYTKSCLHYLTYKHRCSREPHDVKNLWHFNDMSFLASFATFWFDGNWVSLFVLPLRWVLQLCAIKRS